MLFGAVALTLQLTTSSLANVVAAPPLNGRESLPVAEVRGLLFIQHTLGALEERLFTAPHADEMLARIDAVISGEELPQLTELLRPYTDPKLLERLPWEQLVESVRATVRRRLSPAAAAELEGAFADDLLVFRTIASLPQWPQLGPLQLDPYQLLSRAPAPLGELLLVRYRGAIAGLALFGALAVDRNVPTWVADDLARRIRRGSRAGAVLLASALPDHVSEADVPLAERLNLRELEARQVEREAALTRLVEEAKSTGRDVWPTFPPELDD